MNNASHLETFYSRTGTTLTQNDSKYTLFSSHSFCSIAYKCSLSEPEGLCKNLFIKCPAHDIPTTISTAGVREQRAEQGGAAGQRGRVRHPLHAGQH